MNKIILFSAILAFSASQTQAQTVTDFDGNVYHAVTIGTQVWLKENSKATHFSDGSAIPIETDPLIWPTLKTAHYCDYNNTPANSDTSGRLYNWFTAHDSRNVCPVGFHVPDTAEWSTLVQYWGGDSVAAYYLKEAGSIHWDSDNDADNSSGFTALPGGYRHADGAFNNKRGYSTLWTSSTFDAISGIERFMFSGTYVVYAQLANMIDGFSIRCMKNSSTGINESSIDNYLQIYPNPSKDRISIKITVEQNLQVQIYDLLGECVLKKVMHTGKNDIDISILPNGVYIIQLIGSDRTIQRKLVKD